MTNENSAFQIMFIEIKKKQTRQRNNINNFWRVLKIECHRCVDMLAQINKQNDPIYPTPPLGQDMTQGQFFKRSLTGLNSELSFS